MGDQTASASVFFLRALGAHRTPSIPPHLPDYLDKRRQLLRNMPSSRIVKAQAGIRRRPVLEHSDQAAGGEVFAEPPFAEICEPRAFAGGAQAPQMKA